VDALTVSVGPISTGLLSSVFSTLTGIAMMQTYCQRSIALAHESSLTVPELKWVGFRLDDIMAGTMTDETVMPLTATDRQDTFHVGEEDR
jgi:hypothetical protein